MKLSDLTFLARIAHQVCIAVLVLCAATFTGLKPLPVYGQVFSPETPLLATFAMGNLITQPTVSSGQNTDIEEIETELNLDIPASSIPTVLKMAELFGAGLPDDIAYTPANVKNPVLRPMAFFANYDEGYCGHFSIPGEKGAAADFAQIMAQADPFEFIRKNLTFGDQGRDEWVIFSPGLNTLHARKPGWEQEQTAPQRLEEQYQPILGTPISHLHLGTDMDQGDAVVPLSLEGKVFLEQMHPQLQAAGVMPEMRGDYAVFNSRQRDRVEVLLSQKGLARPLFQQHVVRLLQVNETAQRPIVWMAYSRATPELSGALQTYIGDYIQRRENIGVDVAKAQVEAFLREHLTVLTIGNAIRQWPDGPAYIHYSGRSDRPEGGTDPLTNGMGVHIDAPEGAGRDAVFLHADGLFSGFDAHNFGASGAATLKLIMDLNGFTTYRQIWEQGQGGAIKVPNYEQIAAQVVLTDGGKWVWEHQVAWNGVYLPTYQDAQRIIADLLN
ncbi:MAG: hypothetical protein F6K30_07545 [Cyanothece sp. SIO2G6]|nr:hypothetical protein [Cyanothece sp. SIO2G6]